MKRRQVCPASLVPHSSTRPMPDGPTESTSYSRLEGPRVDHPRPFARRQAGDVERHRSLGRVDTSVRWPDLPATGRLRFRVRRANVGAGSPRRGDCHGLRRRSALPIALERGVSDGRGPARSSNFTWALATAVLPATSETSARIGMSLEPGFGQNVTSPRASDSGLSWLRGSMATACQGSVGDGAIDDVQAVRLQVRLVDLPADRDLAVLAGLGRRFSAPAAWYRPERAGPATSMVVGRAWPERSAVQMANQNSPSPPARNVKCFCVVGALVYSCQCAPRSVETYSCASTGCQAGSFERSTRKGMANNACRVAISSGNAGGATGGAAPICDSQGQCEKPRRERLEPHGWISP